MAPNTKEGKPNESQPISLAHDIWGFINGNAHQTLTTTVEKLGILNNDVMVYMKGRSTEDIVTCIILMLKEANETGDPLAIIMEDEEKSLIESPPNSKLQKWQQVVCLHKAG